MAKTPMEVYSGADIVFENVKYPASGTMTLNTNSGNVTDFTNVIPSKTGYTYKFLIPLGIFQGNSAKKLVTWFHNGEGKTIEYYVAEQITNCVARAMVVYTKNV